jgi:transposase InsO family protein
MQEHGIPGEVLSDNGKQFTGRFGRPRPAEVLFERICRENGITQRLTRPRSPTTTGKIQRLHQTLQQEPLNVHGPFADIEDAQAAVDTWRKEYNADRPHQSLAMAIPQPGSPVPSRTSWACGSRPSLRGRLSLRSLPAFLTPIPARHWPCRQLLVSPLTGRRWS